jgi:hypothetical protein
MLLLKLSCFRLQNRAVVLAAFLFALVSGCASVPMASLEDDAIRKEFNAPTDGKAGLYIYRNSNFGGAIKKNIYVDQQFLGQTAPMVYHYVELDQGEHIVTTESEFGNNDTLLKAEAGVNYFVRAFMKMGLVVAGAGIEQVDEAEGKKGVMACELAK